MKYFFLIFIKSLEASALEMQENLKDMFHGDLQTSEVIPSSVSSSSLYLSILAEKSWYCLSTADTQSCMFGAWEWPCSTNLVATWFKRFTLSRVSYKTIQNQYVWPCSKHRHTIHLLHTYLSLNDISFWKILFSEMSASEEKNWL